MGAGRRLHSSEGRRMTRRRPKRAKVQIRRMPWGEPFDRLFRLGKAGDWTPPADVLIRAGSRTWSYVADFRDKHGYVFRATIKVCPTSYRVLDERLEVRMLLKGKS